MVFYRKIGVNKRAKAFALRKTLSLPYSEIAKICKISKTSARRYGESKKSNAQKRSVQGKKPPKIGRPNILSTRDKRLLARCIKKLREENINFTVKQLIEFSGLSLKKASYRTYVRAINEMGYKYLQTRKKGMLSARDKRNRYKFAREQLKHLKSQENFWTHDIAFYLDGVSFIYKRNPKAAALSPKAKAWRLRSEGLEITSKGSKCLGGGKRLHLMVVVGYSKGVLFVEAYEHMDGTYFADFVQRNFAKCFRGSILRRSQKRLFVMDNDPSQSSSLARKAIRKSRAHLLRIPPRSPDINPIENVFHSVKTSLETDAISQNIERESFEDFRARVISKFMAFDSEKIDSTIASLPKRLALILSSKGSRTKY